MITLVKKKKKRRPEKLFAFLFDFRKFRKSKCQFTLSVTNSCNNNNCHAVGIYLVSVRTQGTSHQNNNNDDNYNNCQRHCMSTHHT